MTDLLCDGVDGDVADGDAAANHWHWPRQCDKQATKTVA